MSYPRTHTPDRINPDGSRTITMERACNGCGQLLGDVDARDADDNGQLTDVRAECDHCRPLVELEAAGCKTWQLTERNIARIDNEIDGEGIYAKGYWQTVNGELTIVGLRIGHRPGHIVARFGDWIIHHPDGKFTVHPSATPEGGDR